MEQHNLMVKIDKIDRLNLKNMVFLNKTDL